MDKKEFEWSLSNLMLKPVKDGLEVCFPKFETKELGPTTRVYEGNPEQWTMDSSGTYIAIFENSKLIILQNNGALNSWKLMFETKVMNLKKLVFISNLNSLFETQRTIPLDIFANVCLCGVSDQDFIIWTIQVEVVEQRKFIARNIKSADVACAFDAFFVTLITDCVCLLRIHVQKPSLTLHTTPIVIPNRPATHVLFLYPDETLKLLWVHQTQVNIGVIQPDLKWKHSYAFDCESTLNSVCLRRENILLCTNNGLLNVLCANNYYRRWIHKNQTFSARFSPGLTFVAWAGNEGIKITTTSLSDKVLVKYAVDSVLGKHDLNDIAVFINLNVLRQVFHLVVSNSFDKNLLDLPILHRFVQLRMLTARKNKDDETYRPLASILFLCNQMIIYQILDSELLSDSLSLLIATTSWLWDWFSLFLVHIEISVAHKIKSKMVTLLLHPYTCKMIQQLLITSKRFYNYLVMESQKNHPDLKRAVQLLSVGNDYRERLLTIVKSMKHSNVDDSLFLCDLYIDGDINLNMGSFDFITLNSQVWDDLGCSSEKELRTSLDIVRRVQLNRALNVAQCLNCGSYASLCDQVSCSKAFQNRCPCGGSWWDRISKK